jgi:hypothetical protein
MFKIFTFFISFLSLLLTSCSDGENYDKAYGFEKDGKSFLMLKGERQLAAHDPGSLISNETYKDSLVLEVPSLQNGEISSGDIPVKQGRYKYLGSITIQGDRVHVKLSYDNTDDKTIDQVSWNGKYILVRN